MTEPVLELRGIEKIYRTEGEEVAALRGVNLRIDRGEFTAIIGPSGSGKSTLLNVIGCLDTPTSGEFLFEGRPAQSLDDERLAEIRNEKIGFVFQNFNLLPKYSARKNVELPLIYAGFPRAERRRRAEAALTQVGLAHRITHRPSQLSGGEKQRVAIARALVTEPSILLADEPTGNLDTRVGSEIIKIFEDLHQTKGLTVLIITHDPAVAARCRRTISILDGLIVKDTAA